MIPTLATSPFCGPCKLLKTRLDEIGAKYEIRDMMEHREYFTQYQIRSVPVLITAEAEKICGVDQILAYFQEKP